MAELRVEDVGAVRRIVLNRPEKRNALGHHLIETLLAEFERADRDEAIRVVVLAGEGAGFCAGADLSEAKRATDETAIRQHADLMARLLLAPQALAKPIVAEVHGFALGAGFGLALACDVAFCAEGTALSFPETRHGMVPALVAPPLLRRVGEARAFEILATGRTVPVAEAIALGLVRPVGSDGPTPAAMAFAGALTATPGPILTALKALLRDASGKDMPTAMGIGREANIAGKLRRLVEAAS